MALRSGDSITGGQWQRFCSRPHAVLALTVVGLFESIRLSLPNRPLNRTPRDRPGIGRLNLIAQRRLALRYAASF